MILRLTYYNAIKGHEAGANGSYYAWDRRHGSVGELVEISRIAHRYQAKLSSYGGKRAKLKKFIADQSAYGYSHLKELLKAEARPVFECVDVD